MKYVYQYATQVMIWLGPAEESTSRGLDLIHLAATCLRQESGEWMPRHDTPAMVLERFDDVVNRARGFPSMEDPNEWDPVVCVLNRDWFSRYWIIQESALATMATIQVGLHSLEWLDLCVAIKFFAWKSYPGILKGFSKARANVFPLCGLSRIGLELDACYALLIDLFGMTVRFHATEPHDRIFAFLSLAREGEEFKVDYDIALKDLYSNVSRFLL
jgi:Heterokaryon incompatibility protein (HET)